MKVTMIISNCNMLDVEKKMVEIFGKGISLTFEKNGEMVEPSKWIKVKDNLPQESFLVWVCDEANNVYPAFRLGENYFDRHGNLIESLERVVSWQPIVVPQPPKENE